MGFWNRHSYCLAIAATAFMCGGLTILIAWWSLSRNAELADHRTTGDFVLVTSGRAPKGDSQPMRHVDNETLLKSGSRRTYSVDTELAVDLTRQSNGGGQRVQILWLGWSWNVSIIGI